MLATGRISQEIMINFSDENSDVDSRHFLPETGVEVFANTICK